MNSRHFDWWRCEEGISLTFDDANDGLFPKPLVDKIEQLQMEYDKASCALHDALDGAMLWQQWTDPEELAASRRESDRTKEYIDAANTRKDAARNCRREAGTGRGSSQPDGCEGQGGEGEVS